MPTRQEVYNQFQTPAAPSPDAVPTVQNQSVPTTTTARTTTAAQFQPIVNPQTGKWMPPAPPPTPESAIAGAMRPGAFQGITGTVGPTAGNRNAMYGTISGQQPTVNYGNDMIEPGMAGGAMGPYAGGRGNYMGYGYNAGGLRIDPNYLPETFDYKQSPEYLNRVKWAERDLNRRLLAMGRSDSTGGINAMANLYSRMAADEIDKQYQRGLAANVENYNRMYNANQTNYGRTISEDERAYARAMGIDERDYQRAKYGNETDWNRNWQLANLGYGATTQGVGAGNATAASLANLLSQNGANQASLALANGSVSADQIARLLQAGISFAQIEGLIPALLGQGNTNVPIPQAVNVPGAPITDYGSIGNIGATGGGYSFV